MRTFCAVRHSIDPRFFYGGLWSGNFYPALRQLGHEIIESQVDLLPTSRFMHISENFTQEELGVRTQTTEQILSEVRAAQRQGPVNLFLSYFYNSHFDPAGFDELRRFGIPSVNFYCNSIHQFANVAAIAAKVDFPWHAERDARASYLKVGANPIWVQMGADPKMYRPINGVARQPKACFVGQRYADRDRWIAALVQAEIPVDVYGSGWRLAQQVSNSRVPREPKYLGRRSPPPGSLGSYVDRVIDELRRNGLYRGTQRLIREAKYRRETRSIAELLRPCTKGRAADLSSTFAAYDLCLNFNNVWGDGHPGSRLIPHVRMRDFEGPMCRTCYLTGHTEEIEDFYDVGKEIDTYRTPEELVGKARFYLKNPCEADRLRNAGYIRATRDHTWLQRFKELFQKIGVGGA